MSYKKRIPLNSIGVKLKEARQKLNLTEEELSWKINNKNIDKKKIKNWERGQEFPNLDEIYLLASYLDVNPNELLKLRNQIQDESQSEPNWAARRVFGSFFKIGKPGMKFIFEIILGISVITLAANTKKMLNKMQGDQEEYDFVVNTIQDDIDEFVYHEKEGLEESKKRKNRKNQNENDIVNEITIDSTNELVDED